jgi:hypothetical protein
VVSDKRRGEATVFANNALERVLLEVDKLNLIDGDGNVPDPEQRADARMPSGLHQHALARIDQDDR